MTTHTVPFHYTTGQTLTAKIFTAADALEDEASSVTEATNRKQRYVATFEDVAAGDYMMVYYIAGTPVGYELVRFTGVNGEVAVLLEERLAVLDSATQTQITAIETFAARMTTGISADGPVWQFTANMLELGPSGGDATLAKQEEILASINNYIAGLTALAVEEPGSITGFPETLRIGDSYTDVIGRAIQIPIVDSNGNPISSAGSKNFADATATFVIKRFSDTETTRIINGSATFVDPPGTGTSATETPYALIEIPSSETAKGLTKYRYTGLLTFTWPYVGTGTDAEVMTFETGTITFET